MKKGKVKVNDEGMMEVESTSRLALLWSFNPISAWKPPHQMVGSVHAHKGHLDIYGAVY